MLTKLENSAVGQNWKRSVSFQSQRKAMPKNVQTTTQLHSSHMLVKSCSKILQARLQQYMNHELPDVQAGFRKGRGTRDQIANNLISTIARRDKKAFLSDQCKEVEENNRMGKTRDLFKKIRDSVTCWVIEKARNSQKTSTSALLTMLKPLTMWIKTNCGKFLKRWEYQTNLPASWEICMHINKQQLELDMEQQPGYKSGRSMS